MRATRASGNWLFLSLAIAGLAALIAGYTVYWHALAERLRTEIETWAANQQAAGYNVHLDWTGIKGFPFAFRAIFRAPAVELVFAGQSILWEGDDLTVTMRPWDIMSGNRLWGAGRITLYSEATQKLSLRATAPGMSPDAAAIAGSNAANTMAPAPETIFEARGFSGAVRLYGDQRLAGLTLEIGPSRFSYDNIPKDTAIPQAPSVTFEAVHLALDFPAQAPADYRQPLLDFDLAFAGFAIANKRIDPLPDQAGMLAAQGTWRGPLILTANIRHTLAAWRDAGGVVDIKSLTFKQDSFSLSAGATLALDENLQPLVAASMQVSGLGTLIDLFADQGSIAPKDAFLAKAAMAALETPDAAGENSAKLPLTLENSALWIGPVQLFSLPPIVWPIQDGG